MGRERERKRRTHRQTNKQTVSSHRSPPISVCLGWLLLIASRPHVSSNHPPRNSRQRFYWKRKKGRNGDRGKLLRPSGREQGGEGEGKGYCRVEDRT